MMNRNRSNRAPVFHHIQHLLEFLNKTDGFAIQIYHGYEYEDKPIMDQGYTIHDCRGCGAHCLFVFVEFQHDLNYMKLLFEETIVQVFRIGNNKITQI